MMPGAFQPDYVLDLREISSPPNWFCWSIGVHGIFRWSVKGGGRASKSAPSAVTTAQDPTGQRKPQGGDTWKLDLPKTQRRREVKS